MTPDDVYALIVQRSGTTQYMMAWAIGLLVVNLLIVAPASLLFLWDKATRKKQYEQSKRVLDMAERHGVLSDAAYKRKAELIAEEVRHILEVKYQLQAVQEKVVKVEEKVAEASDTITRVDQRLPEFPAGGVLLTPVDPLNPPKRRAEDKV
jgi:hypothetical protein